MYDAAGQLCWTTTKSLPATQACGAPVSGAATFSWDLAGRLLNETRTATNRVDYSYDDQGRLATVARVNGTAATTQVRSYTPDGMLASTVNSGSSMSSSRYSWDPLVGQVPQLAAITTGTVTSNLTYGPTGWVGVHRSVVLAPVAVATDVYGSVIASTGNTLARTARYNAFGVPSGSNTFEPRLGYRGELTLDNQLWLRARSYQPTLGRFTTRDPAPGRNGTTTVADPYHYGDNNPLNRIDPTGTISQQAANGNRPGTSGAVGAGGRSGPVDPLAKMRYEDALRGLRLHGVVISPSTMTYEEAEAATSELRFPGVLPNSLGACGNVSYALGGGGTGSGCLIFDGGSVTALAAGQVQVGGAVASVGYGPLLSNADHHSQLLGSALCVGAGFKFKVGLGAEVCVGLNEDLSAFTGIWTAWGGGGLGLAYDVHMALAYTWEVFSQRTPCLQGPNLPSLNLPGGFLDVDLPKLPSIGCG